MKQKSLSVCSIKLRIALRKSKIKERAPVKRENKRVLILFVAAFAVLFITGSVFAAGGVVKSPTGTASDRYVYYPGTLPTLHRQR
jgi:hypothetical protein